MTSQHTKQRLQVVSGAIETESGIPIARMDREPGNGTTPVERDDTAKRMVLAYNGHDDLVDALQRFVDSVKRGKKSGLSASWDGFATRVFIANKALKRVATEGENSYGTDRTDAEH